MTRIAIASIILGLVSVVGSSRDAHATTPTAVYYGDDSGDWPSDGECDDPRFEGAGTAWFASELFGDATDCRLLHERNLIRLRDRRVARSTRTTTTRAT